MRRNMIIGILALTVAVVLLGGFQVVSGFALSTVALDSHQRQSMETLSSGSEKILKAMRGPVDLYYFYSGNATKELPLVRNYARQIEGLLGAYEESAAGKIRLHLIDPDALENGARRADQFGLQPLALDQATRRVYFGLAGMNAHGARQVIPVFRLDDQEYVERQVSQLIQRLDGAL